MLITNKKQFLIDSVENLVSLGIMDTLAAKSCNVNQRNFVRYRTELSLRLLNKNKNENIYQISH